MQVHHCEDTEQPQAFRTAAELHLKALGIEYICEEDGNDVQFKFGRFSDRMMFVALIEQGTLDASARGTAQVRAMQRRPQDVPGPRGDRPELEPA